MNTTQEKNKTIKKINSNTTNKNILRLNKNENGITLIALVVTIVVMLILAGITLQTALGDGGLIDLANQSKEQQIIATYKDRIGIVGINWSLNRALDDSVTVDDLWQDMQDAGIIEDKDRDVEKLDDNGNYIITVPEGYRFQIHINEYDDVEVEYIGKENNLLPYISAITVVSQTTNSVELQVSVSRLNGGTLSYYYKKIDEPDKNYQLVKGDTTELTASITGLTDKTTYTIKVEATNENGTVEKTTEVLIGELKGAINQKGEIQWNNGTATIHLETEVANVSILYQINSTEGTYLPYDDAKGITGLAHGDTVFAVLSDGTNITDYTSINILDNLPPQNATINLSGQSTITTGNVTATVTHADNESGVDIANCRWAYNTNPNLIGTEEGSYTNTFSSNGQTITLSASTTGIYYLHVLTVDKAENKTETISQGITVTPQLVTGITVSPTSVTLENGQTRQLSVTITPNNASNKNVTWSSNNSSIASVSSTGLVTAKGPGTATITVKANDGSGKQATCSVTVTQLVTNITVSPTSVTLEEGQTRQLSVTITPSNASNKAVSWSSNSTTVATVSSNGLITAKKAGIATITVKTNDGSNKSATCSVTVNPVPPTIEETLKEGNYVDYIDGTGITRTCVVLYGPENTNYSSYGIQLITMETVENVTLGDDSTPNTITTKLINDYNNVVNILNNATSKYLNTTYADKVRSIGSVPNNSNYDAAGMHTLQFHGHFSDNYDGKLKDIDTNYLADYNQMTTLKIQNLNENYWLASRLVESFSDSAAFHVRIINSWRQFEW